MTLTGLESILGSLPKELKGKSIGILCHAPSITSRYVHIIDALSAKKECCVSAVFGPQHGLFGQTQDNMVEWEGVKHPVYNFPVYSLYGKHRKPSPEMIKGLDALVIDLQDVGARPYTYIWTVKLCMEACVEAGIPVWILDRPNPIGKIGMDGPMLSPSFFTFVGGASIPLCHRMTMGEIAVLMQQTYFPRLQLHVVWMKNWWRKSTYGDTDLPWILPSPNMPTLETAVVYPGMVLFEALNLSEGRGTTRPFEIWGAPFLNISEIHKKLVLRKIPGCIFREHHFIPSFQKWAGKYCAGMQIHVTDINCFKPVFTAASIIAAVIETSASEFSFKQPPYEYEQEKMPFDILSGNCTLRKCLESGGSLAELSEKWSDDHKKFQLDFSSVFAYPELLP
jgi:uncharacterized protein YbbC (DUF1343 family)